MNERERVLTLLRGGRPDQVPWFGDLDYWATALVRRGLRPPDFKRSRAYIEWHRELGVGYYLQGYYPFRAKIEGVTERRWQEGDRACHEIVTPHGTLREVWTYMPESFSNAPSEFLLKGSADLPAYRYCLEHTQYESDFERAEQRRGWVGQDGLTVAYLPKSPMMQLIAQDAGVETTTEIFAAAPEEFEKTLETIRLAHDRAARLAVGCPVDMLMIPENLTSECVGPTFFEMGMRDYQEHWAREIAAAGKFSFIHMDGTLRGLLKQEATVGLTFLEALTPAPVGDLAVEEWASYVGDSKVIFWGGIPGVYFTDKTSDRVFEQHVRQVLAVMRSCPRYVLGVADQVPPDGLEYRVRRVRELVDAHGRY